jgi:c-di-GMP-binding flagellar brake protein YcgR
MTTVPEPNPPEQFDETKLQVGVALAWPLLDENGRVLLRAGAMVATEEERRFLLKRFSFYADKAGVAAASADGAAHDASNERLTLAGMRLSIGAPMGIRSLVSTSSPMRRSKLIGVSGERMLFVASPTAGKSAATPMTGENVQVVAIGANAVYSFFCTVLAVCHQPSEYLVLSEPGVIRMLRVRKALRVRTRIAVRYRKEGSEDGGEGLGLGRDLSVRGMSLVSPRPVADVGARVHIAFPISTAQGETEFEAPTRVRNVKEGVDTDGSIEYGLEFEAIGVEQQFALRSVLFDCLSARSYP